MTDMAAFIAVFQNSMILGMITVALFVIGLALTLLWMMMLMDIAHREFVDGKTKLRWVLVIALTHVVGALLYLFVGRPQSRLARRSLRRSNN
jgi:hypothetical protein